MTDTKYNGWTNYETWAASLWLDGMEETAQEHYDNAWESTNFTKREQAALDFADYLKEVVEEMAETTLNNQSSLIADFVNAGISQINFYELAENMLSDIPDDEAA